jgi:hypothetical protein
MGASEAQLVCYVQQSPHTMTERRSISGDAGGCRRNRAWKWIVIAMAVAYLAFSLWFMFDIRARLRRLEHSDIKGRLQQNYLWPASFSV